MKSKFVYRCEVIIYEKAEIILPLILRDKNIRHYLAITHDKDRYETGENQGELKKLHTHLYLSLYAQRCFNGLAFDYTCYLSCLGVKVLPENFRFIDTDLSCCYVYATHKECFNEFKHRYDISDLFSDDLGFFIKDNTCKNIGYEIVRDIEDGNTKRSMAQKFGREYILHYQAYRDFVSDMLLDERHLYQKELELKKVIEPVQTSIDDIF